MRPRQFRKYYHPELKMYVPSITGCDIENKPWIAPWVAKATLACAMEYAKTKDPSDWSDDDIKHIKAEYKRQSERGMHIGTIFHEMALDNYLAKGKWIAPEQCPSWDEVCDDAHEFDGYGEMSDAFSEFAANYIKDVVDVEFVCFGDRYAGRCDFLAMVSNYAWLTKKAQKTTPEQVLLTYCDLKTSNQYSEFTPLQISGYREADGRVDDRGKSADGLIIRADKDKRKIYTKHVDDEVLSMSYVKLMNRVDFIWSETNWAELFGGIEKVADVVESGTDLEVANEAVS